MQLFCCSNQASFPRQEDEPEQSISPHLPTTVPRWTLSPTAYDQFVQLRENETSQPTAPPMPTTTSQPRDVEQSAVPEGYICPITQNIMEDPVVVSGSGNVYEREAIENWFQNNSSDPLTNVELKNKELVPLHFLRSNISEFLQSQEIQTTQDVQRDTLIDQGEIQVSEGQESHTVNLTPFQQGIDKFGALFPNLFTDISNGQQVFTDQNARKDVVQIDEDILQLQNQLKEQQEMLKKFCGTKESINTAEQVTMIMFKVTELQNLQKKKKTQLQAKNEIQELLDNLDALGSAQDGFIKMQELGIRSSRYVSPASSLIVCASQFEKSVSILLGILTSLLEREVQPNQIQSGLVTAQEMVKLERERIYQQLQQLTESACSSDQMNENVQNYSKLDDIYSYLKKSEDAIEKAHKEFVESLEGFYISIGLLSARKAALKQSSLLGKSKRGESVHDTNIGQTEFLEKIKRGQNVYDTNITMKGKVSTIVDNSLILQDLDIKGSGKLFLSGKGKESIKVVNCNFKGVGLDLREFASIEIQGVVVRGAMYYGICVENTTKVKVINCQTYKNEQTGIFFNEVKMVDVVDCKSMDNNGCGIYLWNIKDCVEVSGCVSKKNRRYGLIFESTGYATLAQSTLIENEKDDLHCYLESDSVYVSECSIDKKGGPGAVIKTPTIKNNIEQGGCSVKDF